MNNKINNSGYNSHKFPPDSAGRKMIKEVPVAFIGENIARVRERIVKEIKKLESINYVYVLDKNGKLAGVFSIKDLFKNGNNKKAEEIMERNIIKARPNTDQEKVALLSLKNNIKSVPVVGKDEIFLGVVPSDVILEILYSENLEDVLKMAGIHSSFKKNFESSSFFLARIRIPWLVVGLLGGIGAAKIVEIFETPLRSYFIIASFIPLIVYISDAVAHQSQTLFIKNLVLDANIKKGAYLLKEIKSVFFIALILGGLLSFLSILFFEASYSIAFMLGVSLLITVQLAGFIGIIIPWIIQSLKRDPAFGSGPFSTIVCDILSLIIYFSIASLMIRMF